MAIPRTEIVISHQGETLLRRVLTPGRYIVGSASSDLCVDRPGVCPSHASISVRAHLVIIEDLGSTHGTFVNDRRVTGPVRLFPNQKLRLGSEVELAAFRLREAGEDPESSCSIQQAYADRLLPPEIRHRLKYQIEEEVGRGGMGAVFRAREMPIRRAVAMKVMLSSSSEEEVARFIEEAQITGQLEHPNIVPVHELGVDEHDQFYYTMKHVRGTTLKEVLSRLARGEEEALRRFPPSQRLTIFEKVCDAVAFAHSRGVIHRDLKPENIMLGKFGEVLVMDWGLAVVLPEGVTPPPGDEEAAGVSLVPHLSTQQPSKRSAVAGTPRYMAPEQARGDADATDTRCDIYALGAILYSLLYLEAPVDGNDAREVLENVRAGRTRLTAPRREPRLTAATQGPPISLVAVVRKAMAPERKDRYGTITELQSDIRNYTAGFATRAERAGICRHLLLGAIRYKRESSWLAAFALALAVVGGAALTRVFHERRLTAAALADLRAMAPSFVSQSRILATQQHFDEALEKLNHALRLQPGTAEAHLLMGDILQARLSLPEAAAAYREAARLMPGLRRARINAELCERLAADRLKEGSISREDLGRLYETMVEERRPAALLLPVGQLLGRENAFARQFWRDRLEQLPSTPDRLWDARLVVRADGQLELDLSDTAVADLSPLADMPVTSLNLRNCGHVRDLAPLRNMPLRTLTLDRTGVMDLSPLKDLNLDELSIAGTLLQDLSPLAGSALRRLDCSNTVITVFTALTQTRLETLSLAGSPVGELWFLRGLPLRTLRLDGCRTARGFSALLDLPTLEDVTLPGNFHELPAGEIASLRALSRQPRLRRISTDRPPVTPSETAETPEMFWKQWAPDLAWIEVLLRASGAAERLPDGSWSVSLRGSRVTDLGFLKGARIRKLDLFDTPVSDLRPLAGMPLESLDLRLTKVTDLHPLSDLPLRELLLWRNRVADFAPLSSLGELEVLDLTETNFSDLRLLKTKRMRLLRLGSTKVTDLSPLAGMALEKLHCDTVEVTSVYPLLTCTGLRWLIPPSAATDVELLRDHPTLERLSYAWNAESEPTLAVSSFWKEWKHRAAPR